jgi:acetyl-CoA carboxylase biotin carboxylase subunit
VFRRLLVANRGEVAARIARACGDLGIETVQVFSEPDRNGPWVVAADRAVCIGGPRAYLDADALLQAAEQYDCQALHPGWGFLAENALLAERCAQHGVTFVGPSARLIRTMGDKARAKRAMAKAGLPTVPGSEGVLPDTAAARAAADRVGYPVLLKAVAGGGGRGMRRCADAAELERGFGEASLEAESAFGNAGLYLEKLIERGRHIEFQVLADGERGAVHLGERECSVQRKHQKLVEETPSPAVDAATRRKMGRRVAEALAQSGYRSAGTVEFLLDAEGNFYFMEVNARLQVEHPVTELAYGVDLVHEQLRLACNEPLRLEQRRIRLDGHAVEFRINAEDPARGFMPDPGTVERLDPPQRIDGVSVRWDSAIAAGYRIPPHYDSMVGKLIVHGADRETVLAGAARALAALRIEGPRTTVEFHRRLLERPEFREGRYDVDFLARSGLAG